MLLICGCANSTEFDPETKHPIVALVTEWLGNIGKIEKRDEEVDLGGSMRLGDYPCHIISGTLAHKIYETDMIVERYRHRYEINGNLIPMLENASLRVSGRSADGNLIETVELPNHPWFFCCQFHPEFTSNPRHGHPVFISFIQAAGER